MTNEVEAVIEELTAEQMRESLRINILAIEALHAKIARRDELIEKSAQEIESIMETLQDYQSAMLESALNLADAGSMSHADKNQVTMRVITRLMKFGLQIIGRKPLNDDIPF